MIRTVVYTRCSGELEAGVHIKQDMNQHFSRDTRSRFIESSSKATLGVLPGYRST